MINLSQPTKNYLIESKTKNSINDGIEIIELKESNNKSPMEIIPSNYRHYTGIMFDVNHFAVLDFLRKHRIIIVAVFENNWRGKNSSIIKDKLDTTEQREIFKTYKPRHETSYLTKNR